MLIRNGFKHLSKISNTLQGSIWRGNHQYVDDDVVIKATDKTLHSESVVIVDDIKCKASENIMSEILIQKYLTQSKKCPQSIVKYIDSFQSDNNICLIMQNGGKSLFDFVVQIHEYIRDGSLEIIEWQKVVKIIFKQMIECIEYIHSKKVCHFDLSLENFLINDINVFVDSSKNGDQLKFQCNDIQIKLCDFGLATLFPKGSFVSSKHCGKSNYYSPEISDKKKSFDAKKNDIFCLGVCLFMMSVGTAPWITSTKDDDWFNYIMNGDTMELLRACNKSRYVDKYLIILFQSIFKYEDKRCNLATIKQSRWYKQ